MVYDLSLRGLIPGKSKKKDGKDVNVKDVKHEKE